MHRNLDVALLRALVTIVECGSFTRAGKRLCLTQSAVSLQVKRLEQRLGKVLFERSRRNVQLTEDGRRLLTYARRLLEINDDAIAHVLVPEVSGIVKFGVVEEFAFHDLPQVLELFARIHSGIRLELHVDLTRHLLLKLETDELNIVVGKTRRTDSHKGTVLKRERLLWVTGEGVTIDHEAPLPLIVSPAPCIHSQEMLDALDRENRAWRIVCHAPTMAGVRATVLAGLGVAALDESTVLPGMRVLTTVNGLPALPDNDIVLFTTQSELPAEAARLADFIIDRYGDPRLARAREAELPRELEGGVEEEAYDVKVVS